MNRRSFLKAAVSGLFACSFPAGALAGAFGGAIGTPTRHEIPDLTDYFRKMKQFDRPHPDDLYLNPEQYRVLKEAAHRLTRVQQTVGYGNFHLLSFDDAVKYGGAYARVGSFTKSELDFLEWVFYEDAARYGFFGEKPLTRLTDPIHRRKVVKVPGSGHYLYKRVLKRSV